MKPKEVVTKKGACIFKITLWDEPAILRIANSWNTVFCPMNCYKGSMTILWPLIWNQCDYLAITLKIADQPFSISQLFAVTWMRKQLLGWDKQATYHCKIKVCNCTSKMAFYILFLAVTTCCLTVKLNHTISVFPLCVTLKELKRVSFLPGCVIVLIFICSGFICMCVCVCVCVCF